MGIIGTTVAQAFVTTWPGNNLALLAHDKQNCTPSAFICQFFSKAKFLRGDPKKDFSLMSCRNSGLDELPI